MKFYGIRNEKTGVAVGFGTSSNGDGEFCTDVEFKLDLHYPSNVWLVKNKSDAEKALKHDTPWYSADYNTPSSSIREQVDKDDYYVFEIDV